MMKRKRGERILVEVGDVTVTIDVGAIHHSHVLVGVHAPRECLIVREELATFAQLERAHPKPEDKA